jgi:hypothetical protein
MLKKIILMITALAAFGQTLLGDDYYNYGQYSFSGYSAGGFIDKNGTRSTTVMGQLTASLQSTSR